ncbi:hypothetical protein [Exiguobacterium chiriqhucha]|uniref:hypothetical protein n=1 Tax=Exiguobacterium chiriqhucha TaxID=1385984 RepID=UPI0007371D7B|nr:hypothetical protein [Exiguobacterium chiriqhucha]
MTKQERINVMYKKNQQLAWARSFLLIVMLLCVFSIQRNDLYIVGAASSLVLIGTVLSYESRFVKSLTSKNEAKQIITKQYVYDFVVILLIVFTYLLTGRLGVTWFLPVLVIGFVLAIHRIQRNLDNRLTREDPEQPIRREIKLSNVKD